MLRFFVAFLIICFVLIVGAGTLATYMTFFVPPMNPTNIAHEESAYAKKLQGLILENQMMGDSFRQQYEDQILNARTGFFRSSQRISYPVRRTSEISVLGEGLYRGHFDDPWVSDFSRMQSFFHGVFSRRAFQGYAGQPILSQNAQDHLEKWRQGRAAVSVVRIVRPLNSYRSNPGSAAGKLAADARLNLQDFRRSLAPTKIGFSKQSSFASTEPSRQILERTRRTMVENADRQRREWKEHLGPRGLSARPSDMALLLSDLRRQQQQLLEDNRRHLQQMRQDRGRRP